MGQLTLNGKTISKPFDYKGKKIVKLEFRNKIITLQDQFTPDVCNLNLY